MADISKILFGGKDFVNANLLKIGGKSVATIKLDGETIWPISTLKKLVSPSLSQREFLLSGNSVNVENYLEGFDNSTMTISGSRTGSNVATRKFYIAPKEGYCWSDGTTTKLTYSWSIYGYEIDRPQLYETEFTYSGSTIDPTTYLSGYDTTTMSLSGDYTGIAAGDYYFYITPNYKNGYCWSGGSTESISYNWTIVKDNNIAYVDVEYSIEFTDPSDGELGGDYVDYEYTCTAYGRNSVGEAIDTCSEQQSGQCYENNEWVAPAFEGTLGDISFRVVFVAPSVGDDNPGVTSKYFSGMVTFYSNGEEKLTF